MATSLKLKNVGASVEGPTLRSMLVADSTATENELNRIAPMVDAQHSSTGAHLDVTANSVSAPSITLGGVQRSTWPSSGSATVSIDDVLTNGNTTTKTSYMADMRVQKIAATLTAITIVDYAWHRAADDTDKGAWRKRVGYPTNALVFVTATGAYIYTVDGSAPASYIELLSGLGTITSVKALNSKIVIGSSTGLWTYDFLSGAWSNRTASGKVNKAASAFSSIGATTFTESAGAIVNSTVNSVAITVLPDAPTDEFGMPVTNIAAFTAGGVSEIKNDGTVVNSTLTTAAYGGGYDSLGRIWWNTTTQYNVSGLSPRSAGYAAAYTLSNAAYSSTNLPISPAIASAAGKYAENSVASTNGLTKFRIGQGTASIHAAITNTYNTGYMVGDIRRAIGYDSSSALADKSVKASAGITAVGALTITPVAGGRTAVSGFSAANYLQEASHADWNALGTGDFSIIMSGVKWGTAGTARVLFSLLDASGTPVAGDFDVYITSGNLLTYADHNGTAFSARTTSTTTYTDTAEHTLILSRKSGVISVIVDGISVASGATTSYIGNLTSSFRVGGHASAGIPPWTGGQFSGYVRISATAPTAEQSKDIAAQENALNGGAACLLSNSASVTALDYHSDTNLLNVVNGTATDFFNGLKRVGSVTTAAGITGATAEGQVPKRALLTSGTTNKFWTAERNINAELTEQAKLQKRTQLYSFTSSGTTQALPQGWKAQGALMNLTDGTFAAPTQAFDGYIWTLSSLTTAKSYQVTISEV